MGVREGAEAFLPAETAGHPAFAVDEVGGGVLDVAHQVLERHRRLETNQQMRVIGPAIDAHQLLPALGNNASDVSLDLFPELRADQVLAALDGKNDLDVNL